MISSLRLNKFIHLVFLFFLFISDSEKSIAAVDIWKKQVKQNNQTDNSEEQKDITIESPILSDDVNKIVIKIDESEILDSEKKPSFIGNDGSRKNYFG